jgi:hypothetical protein
MNKKVNTLLFILGATVFNVLVSVVSFIALLFIYGKFIHPRIPASAYSWAVSLILISSIAISILVYRAVLKYLLTKIDIEKYFDPIFVRTNIRRS